MTKARGELASTLLERALPRAQREAFARELVVFHIEELNGLGDRLRYLAESGAVVSPEMAQARARVHAIVEALRPNATEVVAWIWDWLRAPLERPEDAFAPATLLRALCPDAARVARWLASLPPLNQVPLACKAPDRTQE